MSPLLRTVSLLALLALQPLTPFLPPVLAAGPDKPAEPASAAAKDPPAKAAKGARLDPARKERLDHTGKRRMGTASFYAPMFHGRKMANGKPMRPNDDNAASRTLPLGTTAKVTNLETGQSTVVTIEDRGPYVPGRIVDLSPGSARDIGLTPKQGLAEVEVAPIAVPQPDGAVKPGDGAVAASGHENPPLRD